VLKTKIALAGAAVVALCTVCPVLHADEGAPSPSAKVSFQDLDLQRTRDVARLYERLSAAADSVCGPRAFDIFYQTLPQYQACVDDAVQKAIAHINRPALTAYLRQRLMLSDANRSVGK
jgi:UrcA family protein